METETKKILTLSKRSSLLLVFFSFALVLSVVASFYKFFVIRDYPIQAQDVCDPASEACFVYHCDVAFEECTGDAVADTSYYKIVERNAKNIPLCDPNTEGCTPLVCPAGEKGCSVTFCEPSEEVECSDPEEYRLQQEAQMVEAEVEVLNQEMDPSFQEGAPMSDTLDQSENILVNPEQ